jgi:hypothetical protein
MHTPTPWYCALTPLLIMANNRPGAEHKSIAVCGNGEFCEQADYDNRDHIVKVVNQYDDLVAALTAWAKYMASHEGPFPLALSQATRHALNNGNYIAPAGWAEVTS